jgi:hypothetical protein
VLPATLRGIMLCSEPSAGALSGITLPRKKSGQLPQANALLRCPLNGTLGQLLRTGNGARRLSATAEFAPRRCALACTPVWDVGEDTPRVGRMNASPLPQRCDSEWTATRQGGLQTVTGETLWFHLVGLRSPRMKCDTSWNQAASDAECAVKLRVLAPL